jgi:hypothetical protein
MAPVEEGKQPGQVVAFTVYVLHLLLVQAPSTT